MKKTALKLFLLLVLLINIPLIFLISFQKHNEGMMRTQETQIMLDRISNEFQNFLDDYLGNRANSLNVNDVFLTKKEIPNAVMPCFAVENNKLVERYTITEDGKFYEVSKLSHIADDIFMPAPIMIEIFDKKNPKQPILSINQPPFIVFDTASLEVEGQNILIKFTPVRVPEHANPPILIPQIVILAIILILCYLFVNYINVFFITPLYSIREALIKIKKDNYEELSKEEQKNPAINDVYQTLNEMIVGLREKKTLQDSFIQGLTHDLRTPALAQDRALTVLENQFKGNKLIEALKNNNETYMKLINLIIEAYSNVDVPISKTDVILKDVIKNIMSVTEPLYREKEITIVSEFNEEYTLYADYTAINRILMNLISNAIENIGYGKQITVNAYDNGDEAIITVEDNGSGIAPEFVKYVFERNTSLHKTGQKAIRGLGLNICKVLTEKQDGEIFVESELDKYTRFVVKLPRKKEKDAEN